MSSEKNTPKLTPEWSAKCLDFFQYWQSVRDGALIPATERILDKMPPRFAGTVYIVDITDTESLVRYQGAELVKNWNMDRTGLDIASHYSAKLRRHVLSINETVVRQPCGYLSQSTYTTSRGRDIGVCVIRLPLAVKAGRPPRIIACVDETDQTKEGELAWETYDVLSHAWCDIGAGIPKELPLMIDP